VSFSCRTWLKLAIGEAAVDFGRDGAGRFIGLIGKEFGM
jgi:hypothetical protein